MMNKFIILLLMMVQQTPSLGSIQFSKNIVGKPTKCFSGAERGRTVDLRLAKPALSQLSYSPMMVGLGGFEPPTSRLSGGRSNQLSYRPAPIVLLLGEEQACGLNPSDSEDSVTIGQFDHSLRSPKTE